MYVCHYHQMTHNSNIYDAHDMCQSSPHSSFVRSFGPTPFNQQPILSLEMLYSFNYVLIPVHRSPILL
jgi:hypothetical protein